MRLLGLAGLAGACLATSPLFAADLFGSAPPPMDAPLAQTELGSNWYIRGDVGYGSVKQDTVVPEAGLFPSIGNQPVGDPSNPVPVTRGDAKTAPSATLGAGFGYRVNDFFRLEADWTISNGPGFSKQQKVYCPEIANAVSNNVYTNPTPVYDSQGNFLRNTYTQTPVPFGYQYDYTTCDGHLNGRQYNNTVLAMGYFDLGNYWLLSPYIGAGVGVNANTLTGSLNFTQTDTGATYSGATVNGSAPGVWAVQNGVDMMNLPHYGVLPAANNPSGNPQPIGPANWTRRIDTTKYTIAASLAAGVGMKISQSATLDVGYHITTFDMSKGFKNSLQSVSVGVRYNIN